MTLNRLLPLPGHALLLSTHLATAYAAELQSVPGFEVVPVGVAEAKMQEYRIVFNGKNGPAEARKLAQLLDVDAVVVGAITDFTPYYPPRVGLDVEWYSANAGFHPIPAELECRHEGLGGGMDRPATCAGMAGSMVSTLCPVSGRLP